MPTRLQLSRAAGFRLHENAVNVARPTRWGNPFRVGKEAATAEEAVRLFRERLFARGHDNDLRIALWTLRGCDLACWCKMGEPCHADVLLEVVNDPRAEPRKHVRRHEQVVIMGDLVTVDLVPDSLGIGSFQFSGEHSIGVWHPSMGPIYDPCVLDLCAGKFPPNITEEDRP